MYATRLGCNAKRGVVRQMLAVSLVTVVGACAGGEEHGVGGSAAAECDTDADECPGLGCRVRSLQALRGQPAPQHLGAPAALLEHLPGMVYRMHAPQLRLLEAKGLWLQLSLSKSCRDWGCSLICLKLKVRARLLCTL